MKWEFHAIKDVYEGLYDGPHATPPVCDDGAIFLGISNISENGHLDFSDIKYISEADLPRWTKRVTPKAGDIVFSYEAGLNRYAIIPEGFHGCLGRRMALIRPNEKKALGKFLYYYFFSAQWRETIAANTIIGTTVDRIPLIKFPKFPVSLPDLNVQRRIVDTLSAYDDLIEVNNKRIKVLEQMAENLYKEWFVRFRFPGHESTEFENGLPKGWKYVKFADIYDYVRGVSYSSEEIDCDEGENLINLKNIQGYGGFRSDGTKRFNGQYKLEQVVHYKDLIMGVTDMTQDRRTVGAVALIPSMSGIISADLIKLISPLDNVFSYCLFRWGYYSTYISQFGNGANVIHLKPSSIKNAKILIPSEPLVNAFSRLVNPMIDQIDALNRSIDALVKQRDLLLPRLMSGKLEV